MKVLIAFLALSAAMYSFTTITNVDEAPDALNFNKAEVVSTEVLSLDELGKISSALNFADVVEAKVFDMQDGGSFLEISTKVDGVVSTQMVKALEGLLVPPCHCGPGADGIYNAWWEGLTPYQYKKPYCLPCLVEVPKDVEEG